MSNANLLGGGGGGAVSSVSNLDGTLTISPTTGAIIASINLSNANTWTIGQQVNASSGANTPLTLKAGSTPSVPILSFLDSSNNVQNCFDNNFAWACTPTSTLQQLQARSRTSMGSVGGDFTFEIKRDGTTNSGNGAYLKLTDNTASAYLKWKSNSFVQNIYDLEFHNANGIFYVAPNSGGNFYYNPVQNTTNISILQISTQTMYPGAGTPSPQGLMRVQVCPIAATSPTTVDDLASQWLEGAPTQGVNITTTRRIASLINTGDAGGYAQIQRAATAQTANVSEWQDVSLNTLLSVDSALRLNLHAQNEIRFQDAAGGQYVAIKAPATATTYTWTLPDAVAGAGQVLTDPLGDGNLDWTSPGGISDGDKGDITVSGGGTVWDLDLTLDQIALATASVDFNSQQATNFRFENRTSDPGSPTVGQVWLRTDL